MNDAYFDLLRSGLQSAYAVASEARAKGFDPVEDVEVKIAKDVAARVEGIVGPPGVADIIRNLEIGGMAREDIAFEVARKIASGELFKANKELLIEQAVRTGLGILTEGVLVAPTEGIAKVRIKQNPDGSDYVAVYYSGPIRSAGGTAVALSLVLADIARRICNVGDYRATETQVMRYTEEVTVYETRCVHLQYLPHEEDIKVIVGNCPVCVDGEPTEEIEVSAYRDVPGVETNRVRGGVPLVICDGVALKAAKLFKYTKKLKLGWDWLEKIIKIKKKEDKVEVKPDQTYLEGLVAGRPVFSHASAKGGFRLRYGRSKTTSLMAKDVHPATMILLDNFLAYGTHMKIERPGKGCVISAHEGLEPPAVLLTDGRVMKVRTLDEAYAIKKDVAEILFLGDLLCTYGDFLKSNHPLLPSGYCEEWWLREIEAKLLSPPQALTAPILFEFSKLHGVPLHPSFTYPWHDLVPQQLRALVDWLKQGHLEYDHPGSPAISGAGPGTIRLMKLPYPASAAIVGSPVSSSASHPITQTHNNANTLTPVSSTQPNHPGKRALEELLIEHRVHDDHVIVGGDDAFALLSSLGAQGIGGTGLESAFQNFDNLWSESKKPLDLVNELSGIRIKAKSPTYIGARMGRPEKAKERKMDGSPHVLFPTGSFKNRSISKQYRMLKSHEGEKTVNLELVRMRCPKCRRLGFYRSCDLCRTHAFEERICQKCGRAVDMEMHCDFKTLPYDQRPVDVVELFETTKAKLGVSPDDVKGVKGLSNPLRVPERLEKGFLRSKHDVYVFRDGTCRFDATDVPLTHFTPKEIGLGVERVLALGYTKDYLGNPITNADQLVPLKHQDILISEYGADYFVRVANFIDEMLMNIYGMKPFYNIHNRSDLVGHLAVGLSPHTSAGVLCRIIGFTKANVGYGHPYFHTAKRRNCFHGEEKILVRKNGTFELLALRELVESNLIGTVQCDDFGTQYSKVAGMETYAFNKQTKRFELARITHVSRHRTPPRLMKLKTKSGREIIVTPDHAFPDRNGNKVLASAVKELLVPWAGFAASASGSYDPCDFDLLSIGSNRDLMIRTNKRIFGGKTDLSQVSRLLGVNYKTFTNYLYRQSYPLQLVKQFCPSLLKGNGFLLGGRRDAISLPPTIPASADFFEILGFYLAEGYIKKIQRRSHQVSITATKPWVRRYLKNKIKCVFGLDATVSGDAVVICSSVILDLFKSVGVGTNARDKRIPSLIYALPRNKQQAFLRGYFSGDGSCSNSGSTLEVNLTSVNKWLIDGTSILLTSFGIKHSISKECRAINSDLILNFYGKPKKVVEYKIRIYGAFARKYVEEIGFVGKKQLRALDLLKRWLPKQSTSRATFEGDIVIDPVVSKRFISSDGPWVYNLTVSPHHSLVCSGITSFQCDGDEDCIMLLMDALVNFSRRFLNETRGGTMDAPLVLSIEINPKEVDDEAHNIEFVSRYPLEFYEAAERITPPGDIKLKTVKDVLDTPEQFELPITHPGGMLDVGNVRTAYVELDSIPDKIETQFGLQEKLRAVDSKDAAERLILSHFIPDLYGNLRSFSRQTFRCVGCNEIFRRVPLAGKCSRCGGNLLLTINKGGIQKYLEISMDIVIRYGLPDYLKQRLHLIDKEIKSIFEDDKIKQTGLSDFL